jgi:malonyl-CoA decarboxylase
MNKIFFFNELFSATTKKVFKTRSQNLRQTLKSSDLLELLEILLSHNGSVFGVPIADRILRKYENLDAEEKTAFFELLADDFGPDRERLRLAVSQFGKELDDLSVSELQDASASRRQVLLRYLNMVPARIMELLTMRADLIDRLPDNPHFKVVDADFKHVLSSWFNPGFLELRQIDWETPATILEKVTYYEAVHAIDDWQELRRRIAPEDRLCFALFRPLVDEPIIVVEVALTRDIPSKIDDVLGKARKHIRPEQTLTVVFYSIFNCQKGFKGINLGGFLLKRVMSRLRQELPSIKTFVTLSPVPGFMKWLDDADRNNSLRVLGTKEREILELLDQQVWWQDADYERALKDILLPAAAFYLLSVKTKAGEALDPVARFHLRNGARLERINWMSDSSKTAINLSAGIMINYLYDDREMEKNYQAYLNRNEIIASPGVK